VKKLVTTQLTYTRADINALICDDLIERLGHDCVEDQLHWAESSGWCVYEIQEEEIL